MRRSPVCGSISISVATTIAAEKSLATVRPTSSDLFRFSRTFAAVGVGALEGRPDTLPPREAVLDHLVEADVRREERLDRAAVDAVDEEHVVGEAFSFAMNSFS